MIKRWVYVALAFGLGMSAMSCENQKFNDVKVDVDRVHVDELSPEMIKVRDYVPEYAVIAHRGSTFWTPEETESAYRWAREIGADYLECDMQVSKDGVVLALHDDNLKRTTNIETVFGETLPREIRKNYYMKIGYSETEAEEKVKADEANFVPNLPSYYTYEELLMLDAGSWFNNENLEEALPGLAKEKQYISTLEDLIMYSKGYRLIRDRNQPGMPRQYSIVGKTGETITSLSGTADIVKYDFGYEIDPVWEAGNKNIPGIYIEFKEPWLNPKGFEQIVYDVLANTQDMNIIEKPEPEDTPFYINNGTINVGNTNGKVILQTFSLESLVRVAEVFQGKVPMCFLLWKGTGATDLTYDDPLGYASFINLGVKYKAHFIGPCIAGAPNDYPELDQPWQDYLIHRAKMKNHPYTFDTYDQMAKYFGQYNFGVADGMFNPPYLDALFTNHSDMSINYMITHGWRKSPASQTLVDAREVLRKLGYLDNN